MTWTKFQSRSYTGHRFNLDDPVTIDSDLDFNPVHIPVIVSTRALYCQTRRATHFNPVHIPVIVSTARL